MSLGKILVSTTPGFPGIFLNAGQGIKLLQLPLLQSEGRIILVISKHYYLAINF